MGKLALTTPLYISVIWTLMISYQLFTQTAVMTIVTYIDLFLPTIGAWLISRIDMIVFICAFAWIFVLSSVVPSVILGKERSVLIQFSVVLILTFISFIIQDGIILIFEVETVAQILNLADLFKTPLIAIFYLSLPYLFMLILDIRSRKIKREEEKKG